jgi:hypothetical protein
MRSGENSGSSRFVDSGVGSGRGWRFEMSQEFRIKRLAEAQIPGFA